MESLILEFTLGDERPRNFWELLYPIVGSFVILFVRFLLTKFIFSSVVLHFNVKDFTVKNVRLETEYQKSKTWNKDQILRLSKQLDVPQKEIESWLELKISEITPLKFKKFSNSLWLLIYYSFESVCGFLALRNKPWIFDLDQCWADFYNQILPKDVWWYFMLCASWSWAQLFSVIYDEKMKDFYIIMVHHVAFITLLYIGWGCNTLPYITLIVFITNFLDIFLQGAKVMKYLGCGKVSNCLFLIFASLWIIVRLWLHPFWLMKSLFVDAPRIIPVFENYAGYHVMRIIAAIFVILNIIWTFFVIKSVMGLFRKGVIEDPRSDSDE